MPQQSKRKRPAISERIRKARLDAGLTQQECCQQLGISISTLSKLESGDRTTMRMETAAKFTGLGMDLDDLIDHGAERSTRKA